LVRKNMVPSWLGHHDHKEETRQFNGNYRYDVALCKRLGGDSLPIGKGLTSKAAAQLSKICLKRPVTAWQWAQTVGTYGTIELTRSRGRRWR
jgi:hypothetical protein